MGVGAVFPTTVSKVTASEMAQSTVVPASGRTQATDMATAHHTAKVTEDMALILA